MEVKWRYFKRSNVRDRNEVLYRTDFVISDFCQIQLTTYFIN